MTRHLTFQFYLLITTVRLLSSQVPLKPAIKPSILSARQYKKYLQPPRGATPMERPAWSNPRGAARVERRRTKPLPSSFGPSVLLFVIWIMLDSAKGSDALPGKRRQKRRQRQDKRKDKREEEEEEEGET